MSARKIIPILKAALGYAERGWAVHPVRGKTPYLARWPRLATTDREAIRRWWTQYPEANVAIVTGTLSGLLVLDVDNKNGHAGDIALRALEADLGALPRTLVADTPHGFHLYFRYPESVQIGNSVSALGDGIDVRSNGGYVVAPPSRINGRTYRWRS